MFKKSAILLVVISLIFCVICSCTTEQENPGTTIAPTAIPETGNEADITTALIDIDTIKVGDKISVFTVSEVDIKKEGDGSLESATIKFTGSLAVRGSYTLDDNIFDGDLFANYSVLEDYIDYLPYPRNVVNKTKAIGLDFEKLKTLYGDAESGYAAVVIEEYVLTYNEYFDGEWRAVAASFSKDENEYAVIP